ncbi:hypothetical protein E9993_04125 [Labilibacter sediminis]|nr:hypothetical protein E9993_04125 [Labilibacter sediminis]
MNNKALNKKTVSCYKLLTKFWSLGVLYCLFLGFLHGCTFDPDFDNIGKREHEVRLYNTYKLYSLKFSLDGEEYTSYQYFRDGLVLDSISGSLILKKDKTYSLYYSFCLVRQDNYQYVETIERFKLSEVGTYSFTEQYHPGEPSYYDWDGSYHTGPITFSPGDLNEQWSSLYRTWDFGLTTYTVKIKEGVAEMYWSVVNDISQVYLK